MDGTHGPGVNVSNTVNVRPGFLSNPRMPKWRFRRRFRIGIVWTPLYAHYWTFEAPFCSPAQHGNWSDDLRWVSWTGLAPSRTFRFERVELPGFAIFLDADRL